MSRSGPLRLTAIVLSNRSEVTSANSEGGTGAIPALLTSTSMHPNSATVDVDERFALLPVADMATHRQCPPAHLPHLLGHRLPWPELAAGHDDIGARLGEPEDHLATETLAAPGHDYDLPGRVELGISPSSAMAAGRGHAPSRACRSPGGRRGVERSGQLVERDFGRHCICQRPVLTRRARLV